MLEKAWVYILASDRGVLYIGVTSNLYRRVLDHRAGIRSGFATKYKCHRLIYYEEFKYMTSAIAREKELKGWRRSKKLALIRTTNEHFRDLADGWGKLLPGFEPQQNS
ncbi:GIY-YIG nuclease family protein [Acidobacterium sp. S8]|uniref:GIY-YIG nuclease family protein n=1 Tax=Acidobacterium sp. S8 TaxID=1641854 RepID=UPI00131BA9C3|nr:GIY-YIG nuclease family protein [Acidobacterium sp. S8]